MIFDNFRLTDRVAIVTGAGQGIGEAIALTFADAGADVVLAARRRAPLEGVAERIRLLGRRALVVPCDINDGEALQGLVDQTVDTFNQVDILVNNAGSGGMPTAFTDTSDEHLEQVIHFNLTTRFQQSRLVVEHMAKKGRTGVILNITSVLGRVSDRGYLASGTSNAAVAHMTRLMAADLAPRIRVNAIACGSVVTPALAGVMTNEVVRSELESNVALHRLGQPLDIALAALFLVSPAASWTTGKVFEIDGGQERCAMDFRVPDL
jgi:7-alpha-hydroxysteroid dehydrogenase